MSVASKTTKELFLDNTKIQRDEYSNSLAILKLTKIKILLETRYRRL